MTTRRIVALVLGIGAVLALVGLVILRLARKLPNPEGNSFPPPPAPFSDHEEKVEEDIAKMTTDLVSKKKEEIKSLFNEAFPPRRS